jgi:type I restriction enzyme S subunit
MRQGWQRITLGEVFTTVTGNTPSKTNSELFGQFMPLVKPPELLDTTVDSAEDGLSESGSKVARIAPPNSILISCIGNLGKVGLNTVPVAFNQQINAILPDENRSIPEFMFYQALSCHFKEQLEGLSSGTTVPIVNKSKFNSIEILLPPLVEQQRIVALLDKAFAGLAIAKVNAEKNLQNARTLFESHLQSVFTQRGPGWVEKPLETAASILNGYAFKSTDFSAKNGAKCIKITNVGVREFVSNSDGYLPESFAEEYEKVSVKEGSIVLALTRTIIAGGLKVAVVPEEYDGALLNQRVASIVANEKELNSSFLFAYLSTQTVADYVKVRVNTLMQPNLSITDLRMMPIPVPPHSEQSTITEQFESLREETQILARLYERKCAALEALKKSLLHQAFSGEL